MLEKKSEPQEVPQDKKEMKADKEREKTAKPLSTTVPVDVTATRVTSVPIFTKTSPNDLYRRLLPAVLFVLTFVTVMTMLLVYMDTVALGAQQFRANMSRDYELGGIRADSAALVAYVRQLQLAPRAPAPPQPVPTRSVLALDQAVGVKYNGTFVEILPEGGRDQSTQYLETARGWRGLVARAEPRSFLGLRGPAALHACLAPGEHPAEVTYQSAEAPAGGFSSRVLCLPLLTMLLAARAAAAELLLLGGPGAPAALRGLPWGQVQIQVIEFRSTDPTARAAAHAALIPVGYKVLQEFDDAVMYTREPINPSTDPNNPSTDYINPSTDSNNPNTDPTVNPEPTIVPDPTMDSNTVDPVVLAR